MSVLARVARSRLWWALPAVVAAAVASRGTPARAEDPNQAEARERCASRLSVALVGRGATPELLASPDPRSAVRAMVASPAFDDRLARFLNAQFNARQGESPAEDATYYLARHVLQKKLPYRELFVGKFRVEQPPGAPEAVVNDDPEGLGYFRSDAWLRRYAGNEKDGLKIVTAYRILNNTVGLQLQATTNAPDADVSATGRAASACKTCHFDNWYALDKVASVLTRRVGLGADMKFEPSTKGPQQVVDKTVANDKELVEALVAAPDFEFNACRLTFKFLYGRPESSCESAVFDRCVAAFRADGTLQSAIATVAEDATFCQ